MANIRFSLLVQTISSVWPLSWFDHFQLLFWQQDSVDKTIFWDCTRKIRVQKKTITFASAAARALRGAIFPPDFLTISKENKLNSNRNAVFDHCLSLFVCTICKAKDYNCLTNNGKIGASHSLIVYNSFTYLVCATGLWSFAFVKYVMRYYFSMHLLLFAINFINLWIPNRLWNIDPRFSLAIHYKQW